MLDVIVTADKYGVTNLAGVTADLLWSGIILPICRNGLELLKLLDRADEFPIYRDQMDSILNGLCERGLKPHIESTGFREWLDNRPSLRDELFKQNLFWLWRDVT